MLTDEQKVTLCKDFIEWTGGFAPCEAWDEAIRYMEGEHHTIPGCDVVEIELFFEEWYDHGVTSGCVTKIWDPKTCSFTADPW